MMAGLGYTVLHMYSVTCTLKLIYASDSAIKGNIGTQCMHQGLLLIFGNTMKGTKTWAIFSWLEDMFYRAQ